MVDLLRKLLALLSAPGKLGFLRGLGGGGVGGGGPPAGPPRPAGVRGVAGPPSAPAALTWLSLAVLVFYVTKNVYLGWLYHVEFTIVYRKQTDLSQPLLPP